MSRLFTFGCSFTHWSWPTWADILGREFKEYENWGQRGGGNAFIFHSLIECHKRNKLNKDDTVVIMWSSYFRQDRYRDGFWETTGETLEIDDIKDLDFRGKYIETLSLISAARNLLDHWGVNYTFTSIVPMNSSIDITKKHSEFDDVDQLFSSELEIIRPSVSEAVFDGNWSSRRLSDKQEVRKVYKEVMGPSWPTVNAFLKRDIRDINSEILEEILSFDILKSYIDPVSTPHIVELDDLHPTPTEHLEYIDNVLPEFNVSKNNREWVSNMTNLLLEQESIEYVYGTQSAYQFTQKCYDGIWSCVTNQPKRI